MPRLHHVKLYVAGCCGDLVALHGKTAQIPAFPSEYVFLTFDAIPLMTDAAPYRLGGGSQTFRTADGRELATPKSEDYVILEKPLLEFLSWEPAPRLVGLLQRAFPKLEFRAEIAAVELSTG